MKFKYIMLAVGFSLLTPAAYAQEFKYTTGPYAPGTVTFNGNTAIWTGTKGTSHWEGCKVEKNGGSCTKATSLRSTNLRIQGGHLSYN